MSPFFVRKLPMHFEAFTFVLTAGCWPLQSVSSSFKPPAPIEDYVVSFLDFYGEVRPAAFHARRATRAQSCDCPRFLLLLCDMLYILLILYVSVLSNIVCTYSSTTVQQ